jgi:uncharacterized membrane protein
VFGVRYLVPATSRRITVVAVNIGGALVPVALSGYLIARDHLGWLALAGIAIVAVAVHLVARPVPGLGIAVPALLPGIFGAGTAIMLNPPAIAGVGAPLVSIGGAGTFDAVFMTGIVAVLLVLVA